MSAIPSPAAPALVAPSRPALPAALVRTGRTLALLGLVLLVPGEAARVGTGLHPRD